MLLHFFYQNKLGKIARPLFTKIFTSIFVGCMANQPISRHFIKSFIKNHKIDMSEFIIPEGGYKTFNEFFYRKLRPGTRAIDFDENVVTSPADCKVLAITKLRQDSTLFVKNCKFDLNQFLKDENLAKAYESGTLLLFRLAPQDYHRFHFSFDCIPSEVSTIHGKLESVNPIAYGSGIQPLTENERHLITLNSQNFGQVLFVTVGAMFVGKIKETYTPTHSYKKGDEIGYFAFGGSSIVMLFKKNVITVNDVVLQNSENGIETAIKIGQFVARKT